MGDLFNLEPEAPRPTGPVECLGMTFENDEKRREYFLEKLREKLKDPEFRKIEGFPIGEDEDILALSDPPYYTACPNPFIEDFIKHYGKPYDPEMDDYRREPFAADVSEGKYHPVYKLHPYHTKVPHRAIMRYILHYTEPGDVVYDGFCGTGMTGVAAQLCGNPAEVQALGYQIQDDGSILNECGVPISRLGVRNNILIDLSPAATFIASFINLMKPSIFRDESRRILREIKNDCSWMYSTLYGGTKAEILSAAEALRKCKSEDEIRELLSDDDILRARIGSPTSNLRIAKINFVVWSDVFLCPECGTDIVFWDSAVDYYAGKVKSSFECPKCQATLRKRMLDRKTTTVFDPHIGRAISQGLQVPVFVNGRIRSSKIEKYPDAFDAALEKAINKVTTDLHPPIVELLEDGFNTSQPIRSHGFTYVHHFYSARNLAVLVRTLSKCQDPFQRALVTKVAFRITKRYGLTYQSGSWGAGGGPTTGTLYVPSLVKELNMISMLEAGAKTSEAKIDCIASRLAISTQSSSTVEMPAECCDYIFLDPPFGSNIMYSELNSFWEAWLAVSTAMQFDAIENPKQGKTIELYKDLLKKCFKEAYRVLKPGRWMTVEFSNTKSSIWNAIQTTLEEVGFIVANVSALDKQKGSFKAITTPTAVKQDLIISAYKPNGGLEQRFKLTAGTEEGVWDFVRTHLKQLPVFVSKEGKAEVIAERQNFLLFDRMVAFHVQRGVTVPLSAAEFYAGLAQRFPERDGMYFLPEQVAEYDKKRMKVKEVLQFQLFVTDEASAIQWLKQQLTRKPQTFQELHPQFLKEIGGWQKHEKPLELSEMLEQNFLRYDGKGSIPAQIVSWMKRSAELRELINRESSIAGRGSNDSGLETQDPRLLREAKDRWYVPDPNKAGDLEKLREKSLLREFHEYLDSRQRRLKVFRLEAVRAGFYKAWQERDYATIIAVARKIPEKILQEDPKLLMWFDQALTRMGD